MLGNKEKFVILLTAFLVMDIITASTVGVPSMAVSSTTVGPSLNGVNPTAPQNAASAIEWNTANTVYTASPALVDSARTSEPRSVSTSKTATSIQPTPTNKSGQLSNIEGNAEDVPTPDTAIDITEAEADKLLAEQNAKLAKNPSINASIDDLYCLGIPKDKNDSSKTDCCWKKEFVIKAWWCNKAAAAKLNRMRWIGVGAGVGTAAIGVGGLLAYLKIKEMRKKAANSQGYKLEP